jgi:hypothetical protein
MSQSALEGWPLDRTLAPCTLVFDEKDEWLVGCPGSRASRGFRPTGEVIGSVPVLHHPDPITLSTQRLPYDEIKLGLVGIVGAVEEAVTAPR